MKNKDNALLGGDNMIKYAMPDGFCIIESKTNKTAFYADVFGEYVEMPKKWAEKIVNLLMAGNYKKGLHFVDMVIDRRQNNVYLSV